MVHADLGARLRLGWIVIAVLMVFHVFEFVLSTRIMQSGTLLPLVVLVFIDAGLIIYYFMHVAQLWRSEE